jgi:WD40 repeat protein/DNA-binding SARP family transcriptional activator
MEGSLHIHTLGGLTIDCDGQPVTGFITRKVEALLVYLVCTQRTHAREVLAELLWPDRSQSQSLAALRVGLSNLHQVLPEHVHITRRTVGVVSDSPCWVDVTELEQRLTLAGIRERREGLLSDDEAQALTQALDLYRGDFLEGFYVPDSRAFEDWAELERERLRRTVIEALHPLVLYDLEHGVYADGIAQATRLLALDPLHEEINCHLILLLAQAGQRSQALAQYEAYCRLLDEELGAKPPPDLVALYRQIQAGGMVQAVERPAVTRPTAPTNPYKGLRPFQEADAADFFGREALVQRLVARLSEDDPQARFLAVVGPSGCGKSSVVRAGLLPALRNGAVPGSERWQYVTILPGTHPLDELAIALRRLSSRQDTDVLGELERDTRGLLRVVKQVLPDDLQVELFLLIDQFEEVFSLVAEEGVRRHVLHGLLAALSEPHSRLRAVVTLRADFYDRPLLYPELGELVRQRTEVVLPLTPEELEQAITSPAERVGVSVEPALIGTMVADVNEQPGALPLLQFTLTELFERHEGSILTLAVYRASGGTRSALAARADTLYAAMEADEQQTVRQMFLRLVQLGEGTEDTRRRVPWVEIVAVTGSEAVAQGLVDRFVRHRLLTFDHDPATGGRTVELAHEALIREWRLFHTWIDESRADLQQQRLLAAAAQEWQTATRDHSYLLTGSRLARFEGWAATPEVVLTPNERDFLNASTSEHDEQHARRQRIRNLAFVATATAAVIMAVLALVAFDREHQAQNARTKAEREAAVNRSLVLADAATKLSDLDGPGYALPLALQAVNMDRPPNEAVSTLQDLALKAGTRIILREQGNAIRAVAISPDSRLGLSGGCAVLENDVCTQGELILWDLEARTEVRHFEGHTGWVNDVAFNADGKTILSGSDDHTLILWDVSTGEIIRRLEGHTGAVKSIALSPDGRTAISGADDGTPRIWDVTSGETLHRLEGDAATVSQVVLSPDGKVAASHTDDAVIVLWDVATGQELRRLKGHTDAIGALAFRPVGSGAYTLLSAGVDDRFIEWDVATGQSIRQFAIGNATSYHMPVSPDGRTVLFLFAAGPYMFDMEQFRFTQVLVDHFGRAEAGAISPDGHLILLGQSSGVLRLCDMGASAEVRRFEAEVPLLSVDVSPDGQYLLTGSLSGGVVILWDLQTGQEIRRFAGQEDVVWQVEFSPDGQLAAVGSARAMGISEGTKLVLVDVATGRELHRLEGHKFPVHSVVFSPDGHFLLTGTMQYTPDWPTVGGGDLILWDVETGAMVRRFEETKAVMGIEFSPDGSQVVTGTDLAGPYLSLWDVNTGQLIRRFYEWPDIKFPDEALWEPDGVHVLVSGLGSIAEMNIQTGKVTRVLDGHGAASIMSLDHSPDWQYVVGTNLGAPSSLMLWDFATGDEVRHLTAYNAPTWTVVFSPDGQTVFTSSIGEKPVIEWQVADWPLDQLQAWVHENRYVRDFTCAERAQYRIEPLCETGNQ